MTHKKNKIATHLLEIEAVKINAKNPFTWSSGIKSPIYCDNRLLLSYPEIRSEVREAFVEAALNWHHFDVIGGVATAGIPHGVLVADALRKPFIYVRGSAKSHGRQNQIEGHLNPGSRVLLIEDLISTGGSSLKAVEAVRQAGSDVMGVMAIFTYGFDVATNAFEKATVPFRTLITLDDLLEAATHRGGLSREDRELISAWRLSPEDWPETDN
jgi:orotate phosphoribosyltransferase